MKRFLFISLFFFFCFLFYAQENNEEHLEENDLNFDFEQTSSTKDDFSVSIGGAIFTGISVFFDDFKTFYDVKPSSLVWGKLKLEANAPLSYAFFSVNLNDKTLPFNLGQKYLLSKDPTIPLWIDEAFLQINVRALYFSGGLKKLNWGRSDLFSVIDVVNPKDESANFDIQENTKLAAPMFQFMAYMPHDIKLEGVFLPIFIPDLFSLEGRWKPYSIKKIENFTGEKEAKKLKDILNKDTAKLSYAHGGIKLTTTIALSHDLGFQYFYGYSKKPIISKTSNFETEYPSFHNIAVDYGTAIGPVNLRAELCANIIEHDGFKDSNIAWNTNLDVALKYGLALNLVLKETIYFNQKREASFALFRKNHTTDTLAFISLSQTILRGAMEWKLSFITGFEDIDFAIIPSLHCILGTIFLDAKIGIFLGKNNEGAYSQYKKNSFIKLSIGYEF